MPAAMPAAAASAATRTTTFALRTSFVHNERAAQKIFAIEGCDCFFGFRIVADFRKAKSARLAGETIAQKSERIRLHSNF
jgi:hypothetical protein